MSEKSKVILCIDDEKIVLDSLNAQLTRNFGDQFEYEFAESGDEGKKLASNVHAEGREIHAVISDWLMPGIKGDELLHWVAEEFPHSKRILLTGHMENETIKLLEENNSAGIVCVYKPWEENTIVDLINASENE